MKLNKKETVFVLGIIERCYYPHHNLSIMYRLGRGFEIDEKKEMYHLEESAIGGHAEARFNLGYLVGENGRYDRVIKHMISQLIWGMMVHWII